jgi:hypothetical protein
MTGKKNTIRILTLLGLIIMLAVLVGIIDKGKQQPLAESPEEQKAKQEENTRADQSYVIGKRVMAIRDAMREPGSFQVSKALVMEDGAGCITYRARNGFGGMNVGYAVNLDAGNGSKEVG